MDKIIERLLSDRANSLSIASTNVHNNLKTEQGVRSNLSSEIRKAKLENTQEEQLKDLFREHVSKQKKKEDVYEELGYVPYEIYIKTKNAVNEIRTTIDNQLNRLNTIYKINGTVINNLPKKVSRIVADMKAKDKQDIMDKLIHLRDEYIDKTIDPYTDKINKATTIDSTIQLIDENAKSKSVIPPPLSESKDGDDDDDDEGDIIDSISKEQEETANMMFDEYDSKKEKVAQLLSRVIKETGLSLPQARKLYTAFKARKGDGDDESVEESKGSGNGILGGCDSCNGTCSKGGALQKYNNNIKKLQSKLGISRKEAMNLYKQLKPPAKKRKQTKRKPMKPKPNMSKQGLVQYILQNNDFI